MASCTLASANSPLKWEQVAGGLEEIRFFSAPAPRPGTPDWPRLEGMRSDKTPKRILAARFFSLDPSSGAEKIAAEAFVNYLPVGTLLLKAPTRAAGW